MSNSGSSKKQSTQAELSRCALEAKQKAEKDKQPQHPESRTAGEGQATESQPGAPLPGALDAEGHRPVLERSRKVR